MKRIFLLLALGVALLMLPGQGQARVVNRLGGADFTTIGAALAAANPGETIEIDAAGNPYPDEGLLIIGQTGVTLTSRNGIALLQRTRFTIMANNVTVRDIHMDGQKANKRLITILGTSGATIRACTLVNPASGGTDANAADDLLDMDEALDCGVAISAEGGENLTIQDNDMRSDNDDTLANQGNIQLLPGVGTRTGLVIRGNLFGAETRNVSFWTGWTNVTVENNTFARADLGTARSGTNLLVSTLRSETLAANRLCRNWTIRNNTFTYGNDCNIAFEHAVVEGIVIEGNTFVNAPDFNAVSFQAAGSDVVVRNNTVGSSGSYGMLFYNGELQGDSAAVGNVLVSDNYLADPAMGMQLGPAVSQGIVLRDNVIDQLDSTVGFSFVGGNSSALVQRNVISRGGSSSCVNLDGIGAAILDNVFIGGRRGVSFYSQTTYTSTGGNNLVARNLIVEPGLSGSAGRIHGVGDWEDASSYKPQFGGNRIIGNTIVLSAEDGIYIAAPSAVCYNNISAFNVGGGIKVKAGTTPALLDFNLVFQNAGGNYIGTTQKPHDVVANPRFVTFFGVSTGADFHLRPDSPARNAGTSNGVDPDYVTELGALQDVTVDTAVPAAAWQLYR